MSKTVPKISVIVPVYNTGMYLSRCIESILSQTFDNFELLLIDDGSTDGSYKILQYYESQDLRIRIFHQENGGVTSARLLGVENAKAEWISFVDSDDEIVSNALTVLYTNVQDNIDIVVSNYREVCVVTADEFVKMTLKGEIFSSIWGRIYRRDLVVDNMVGISNLIKIGEDTLMNVKIGCGAVNGVKLIPEQVYNYYENPGSAMRTRVVSLQYEEFFISEMRKALGSKFNFFIDEFYAQCLTSLELLIVCRIPISYDMEWIRDLINWKKMTRVELSLRSWVVLNIRHNMLARYILAIERRMKIWFTGDKV